MTNTYLPILATLQTTTDRMMLQRSLEKMEEKLFQTKGKSISELITCFFPKKQADSILSLCRTNAISLDNSPQVEQFIKTLAKQMNDLPVLNVTLAFEPSEETITLLSTWVQSNIGHGVLLGIQIDKTILGGAIVQWQGIYKDFSLLKTIDSHFSHHKTN